MQRFVTNIPRVLSRVCKTAFPDIQSVVLIGAILVINPHQTSERQGETGQSSDNRIHETATLLMHQAVDVVDVVNLALDVLTDLQHATFAPADPPWHSFAVSKQDGGALRGKLSCPDPERYLEGAEGVLYVEIDLPRGISDELDGIADSSKVSFYYQHDASTVTACSMFFQDLVHHTEEVRHLAQSAGSLKIGANYRWYDANHEWYPFLLDVFPTETGLTWNTRMGPPVKLERPVPSVKEQGDLSAMTEDLASLARRVLARVVKSNEE